MIRPYREKDFEFCRTMLRAEGMKDSEMEFMKHPTTILVEAGPIGFFTLHDEQGEKSLCHFVIDRAHRSAVNIVSLLKALKDEVRKSGKRLIIHEDKPHLDRMIQWYFRTRPYAEKGRFRFYCVEV